MQRVTTWGNKGSYRDRTKACLKSESATVDQVVHAHAKPVRDKLDSADEDCHAAPNAGPQYPDLLSVGAGRVTWRATT
jgi:hypothetical protein